MKSEKFIHIAGSDIDFSGRSCIDSSGRLNSDDCISINKNSGVFAFGKLPYIGALFTFAFSLFTLLSSCDETFQPFQQESHPFSIFGYLDATADTQWVRVVPTREQLDTSPVLPDMLVTLEHLQSGDTVVMRDSLNLNPDGFNFLNHWTDMDIEPGQTYRLTAVRPDGESSRATVTIPEDFPTPVLVTGRGTGPTGHLMVKGVERLADVQSLWRLSGIPDRSIPYRSVPYRNVVNTTSSGYFDFTVFISIERDSWYLFERIGLNAPPTFVLLNIPRQVFVASGGPEWNEELASLTDLEYYAFPERFSNVENGVGYLVGIVSKTIPFKGCFDEQDENIACPEEKPMFR